MDGLPTMHDSTIRHYKSLFTQVNSQLPYAEWLAHRRQTAMDTFCQIGLPNRHQEAWKYTQVDAIAQQQFTLPLAKTAQPTLPWLAQQLDAHRLVFVDGVLDPHLSEHTDLPEGVVLTNIAQALQLHPKLMEQHLMRYAKDNSHGFAALNTALTQDGYVLLIPEQCQINKPIHMVYLTQQSGQAMHIHNLIVADEHSRAEIIEEFIGDPDLIYLMNTVTELVLAEHAEVTHYKIQQEAHTSYHVGDLRVVQARHSQANLHSFSWGGHLVRSDAHIVLQAEQAGCQLNGLYLAQDQQHIDHHTCVDHAKPHGTSREYYKGIVSGKGRAVFNGRVVVAKDAQKTDSTQYNKNLLLSQQAEVDTKPQLEIFADDVRCAHGATVGQLDERALFYMQSRGIDSMTAQHILIHAFATEMLERVSCNTFRACLEQLLDQQLVELARRLIQ